MKKVILMALAAASMFFVSCNDDEKSSGDERAKFGVSLSADTTLLTVGEKTKLKLVLNDMEPERAGMEAKMYIADGAKLLVNNKEVKKEQDFADEFFGNDILSLEYVAPEAKPESGFDSLVVSVSLNGYTATAGLKINIKKQFDITPVENSNYYKIGSEAGSQTTSLKLIVHDEFNEGETFDVSVEPYNNDDCVGTLGKTELKGVKANEVIEFPYTPETVGTHQFKVTTQNSKGVKVECNYSLFVESIMTMKITQEGKTARVMDYVYNYGGGSNIFQLALSSSASYTGGFTLKLTSDDAQLSSFNMQPSAGTLDNNGVKVSLASNSYSGNFARVGGCTADPSKVHKLIVTATDSQGYKTSVVFHIRMVAQVQMPTVYYSDSEGHKTCPYNYVSGATTSNYKNIINGNYAVGDVVTFKLNEYEVSKCGVTNAPNGYKYKVKGLYVCAKKGLSDGQYESCIALTDPEHAIIPMTSSEQEINITITAEMFEAIKGYKLSAISLMPQFTVWGIN